MHKAKRIPSDVEEKRRNSKQLLEQFQRVSDEGKSRIYVDCLKYGYAIKSLESRHVEMLENYTEDKLSSFVSTLFNSSAPVSTYNTLIKAAPDTGPSRARILESKTALGCTLYCNFCDCTKKADNDYCLFRKLSYWEKRKIKKELKANNIH